MSSSPVNNSGERGSSVPDGEESTISLVWIFSFLVLDVDFAILVLVEVLDIAPGDRVGCVFGGLQLAVFARYLSIVQMVR